ncbi:MAG: hypothetical protein J5949_05685 [Oscillospiraceae bacterium]|nr:hypothetical protein [Oscillospiraceae bacterium]
MNDKILLRKLKQGDQAALSELIHRYSAYAWAVAANILSHAMKDEDIEEVVEDSFVSLWENREQIETDLVKA